eukprot:304072-Chlamydomonas_euryale.AAC.1
MGSQRPWLGKALHGVVSQSTLKQWECCHDEASAGQRWVNCNVMIKNSAHDTSSAWFVSCVHASVHARMVAECVHVVLAAAQAIWEELQSVVHAVDEMITQTPAEAGI